MRRYVRLHNCDGTGSYPTLSFDHLCTVCGTSEAQARNMMVETSAADYDRLDLIQTALGVLLAWDENFNFCNVDEGTDTPCICQHHSAIGAFDHDTPCEKYRELIKRARALVPATENALTVRSETHRTTEGKK